MNRLYFDFLANSANVKLVIIDCSKNRDNEFDISKKSNINRTISLRAIENSYI